MADLKDLYRDAILDHYRRPRNYRSLEHASRRADGVNALCGDKLSVFLSIEDSVIRDICFVGTGCAISIASASMMTESVKGKTEVEAGIILERFHQCTANDSVAVPDPDVMGDLAVFSGLRKYPVRVRCATLAWNALRAALEEKQEAVSTE